MNRIFVILFSLFLVACAHAVTLVRGCNIDDGVEYCAVSMVSLLANPDKYDGKRVIVSGYYKIAPEMSGLFLTEDYARIEDYTNAIWISYDKQFKPEVRNDDKFWKDYFNHLVNSVSATNHYVQVIGIYHARPAGHFGVYQGEIGPVPGFSVKSK
jgi:hypothetical protein